MPARLATLCVCAPVRLLRLCVCAPVVRAVSRRHAAAVRDADAPRPGSSAVRKHKAIYRLAGEQVGQWSDVASISVMG